MKLPALLAYTSEEEYKQHYIANYCKDLSISTFDGIPVRFYPEAFEHAFYKRSVKKWSAEKDMFSIERAERMDWIKSVLSDPDIIPKKGYDKAKDSYDNSRRVTFITPENYVVVIWINKSNTAKFVTAYLVDNESAAEKIRNSPNWEK